jgi:6,7-dimethyl-8-ribityllumazine synthase
MSATIPSEPDGTDLKVAVLTTRWYPDVIAGLSAAAHATLKDAGVEADDIVVVEVPGAYELAQAASWLARAEDVDAIVALGCVVRGETPHFDHVARAAVDGLMQVALETGVPIGLGVITADTLEQAQARAGSTTGKGGNKGHEAADAALRMAATYRALEARRRLS